MNLFVEVAVPTPVPRTFTYETEVEIQPGQRVMVPFGPRKLVGVVTSPGEKPETTDFKLKSIHKIVDEEPIYSGSMLKIAQWMSSYYLHPIGEVLQTMLPAGRVVQKRKKAILIRENLPKDGALCDLINKLFGKRSELSFPTFTKKLKAVDLTLDQLKAAGCVRIEQASVTQVRQADSGARPDKPLVLGEKPLDLTPAQTKVFGGILDLFDQQDGPKPALLWGLTGAGKTEIYLQLIATCVAEQTGQVLVLVPEISLTPQMTEVFQRRFPHQVEVVHSALTETERWKRLNQIRSGQKRILIGPRSSVFAPFADLAMIIVDEEHDQSYKQATGLPYHGRDIAILRAKLEGAGIVLGSATPSMESYANAKAGKYELFTLNERVSGRPLPQIEVLPITAKQQGGQKLSLSKTKELSEEPASDIAIHPEILSALKQNLEEGQQSMVIVNRRGFSHYLYDVEKKGAVQCPSCSISLTLHNRSRLMRCHYCDYRAPLGEVLGGRDSNHFVAVGYGSQQAETFLQGRLPKARIVRVDSDTVTQKDYLQRTLDQFRQGQLDILVGTQILAKGHDFPNVTLIAILEIDHILNLPDFRAGERAFQLIVQAAGRAGRAGLTGHVMLQTGRPDHPVVIDGVAQNYPGFAESELKFRQKFFYPPESAMVAIEFSSTFPKKVEDLGYRVGDWLDQMQRLDPGLLTGIRISGPTAPAIEVIRGRHRRVLLLSARDRRRLWQLTHSFQTTFAKLPSDLRLKIDVDPQSLI